MSAELTDADLQAIRERAENATAGPWGLASPRPDGRNLVERRGYSLFGGEVSEMIIVDTNPDDAEFIAHAREDVPALLAEVERLRARLDAVRALHTCQLGGTPTGKPADVCSCGTSYYPCPTIQALDGSDQ